MKTEWAVRTAGFSAGIPVIFVSIACAIPFLAATVGGAGVSGGPPVEGTSQIPAGTILPVALKDTLKLQDVHKGQLIEARIMQDVPLPHGAKIRMRSKITGAIDSLDRNADGTGVNLSLRFNKVEFSDKNVPMVTSLRAIASYRQVDSAQMPLAGADTGTPAGWGTTVQIGGDLRFGNGGKVRSPSKEIVGKGVTGGVLVHVRAKPEGGCEGPLNGDDHLQALWVFSAEACGVYDLQGVKIEHSGKSDGQITLSFEKADMKLAPGTAMLLRIVAKESQD